MNWELAMANFHLLVPETPTFLHSLGPCTYWSLLHPALSAEIATSSSPKALIHSPGGACWILCSSNDFWQMSFISFIHLFHSFTRTLQFVCSLGFTINSTWSPLECKTVPFSALQFNEIKESVPSNVWLLSTVTLSRCLDCKAPSNDAVHQPNG